MQPSRSLRCTLLGDGSSDNLLMRPIRWLLWDTCPEVEPRIEFADLRRMPAPPRSLADRVRCALQAFPADVLLVHRDAERMTRANRASEIRREVDDIAEELNTHYVCVVPVRMTEAWLLVSERAIRVAAGNPNGSVVLDLPCANDIERVEDPKKRLTDLVTRATELPDRRLRGFRPRARFHRIAELIDDYSALRQLSAFKEFEHELRGALIAGRWLDAG